MHVLDGKKTEFHFFFHFPIIGYCRPWVCILLGGAAYGVIFVTKAMNPSEIHTDVWSPSHVPGVIHQVEVFTRVVTIQSGIPRQFTASALSSGSRGVRAPLAPFVFRQF